MRSEDAPAVARVVMRAFLRDVAPGLSAEGIDTFTQIARAEAFVQRMAEDHRMFVHEERGVILGMIELREGRHLAMLFVDPARQREGIGRALLEKALQHVRTDTLSVSASLTSVGAYEKYGFAIEGPEEQLRGLRFRPMRLALAPLDPLTGNRSIDRGRPQEKDRLSAGPKRQELEGNGERA